MTLHYRSSVSWRKFLLLNRAALLRAWPAHFPLYDFSTLRLISPTSLVPPAGWDEHWSASARKYHEERRRKCAM
jgi:hypothetical protein